MLPYQISVITLMVRKISAVKRQRLMDKNIVQLCDVYKQHIRLKVINMLSRQRKVEVDNITF